MATEKTTQILDAIKELTIIELADLVKAVEEEFGVSAAAPVAVAGAAAAGAPAAAALRAGAAETGVLGADALGRSDTIKPPRSCSVHQTYGHGPDRPKWRRQGPSDQSRANRYR